MYFDPFGFVLEVSSFPLSHNNKSEADANCFLKYSSPPNQMMSSPNFSKLKVTAWRGDVFRMLPSSGRLMTLLIIQNYKKKKGDVTKQKNKNIIMTLLSHLCSPVVKKSD